MFIEKSYPKVLRVFKILAWCQIELSMRSDQNANWFTAYNSLEWSLRKFFLDFLLKNSESGQYVEKTSIL